jgi:hypothetical protein
MIIGLLPALNTSFIYLAEAETGHPTNNFFKGIDFMLCIHLV